jgi:lipopolysaccharide export system permease protein
MLRRYLSSLLLRRLLGVLLGLSALLQLLDLLDKTSTVLSRGGLGGVGRYVALRCPVLLGEMIPLATLVGALLCFMRLSRGLEMAALGAAGISVRQVIRLLLPVCLLVSAAEFAFQAEFVPLSERAFADWWARTTPATPDAAPAPRVWLRAGRDVAAVASVSNDGTTLSGLTILRRNAEGDLLGRVDADTARWRHGQWQLSGATLSRPDNTASVPDTANWPDGPAPANMVELARPAESSTLPHLLGALHGHWVSARGPAFLRTQLHALAAGLLDPVIMLVLAAPVLLAPPRTGIDMLAALRVLGLGLGYLAAAGLLQALGNAGTLPPWLAGWSAAAVFGGIATVRLLIAEAG